MDKKPNVLLLMADEHQAAALSCLHHPVVKTPNLDRLAARGTLFENAYTPCPICVPARAALATGQYVHQCGYWDNAMAYDGRIPSWMHVLKERGVPAVSIGKQHYRRVEDPVGFSEQILPLNIFGGVGQVWGSIRDPLPQQPHRHPMLGEIGAGYSKYNKFDENVAATAAEWLGKAERSKPWMAFVSFVAPHFPLVVPQQYLDLYDPATVPWPPLRTDTGYVQHPWVARMEAFQDNDVEFKTDSERRLAIAAYYALCTFVDAQVGKVLDALEETGQAENTIVIYCSDHGETLGMRNRWGKQVLYGEATRIPLILAGPRVPRGRLDKTPVSLIDLPPTICDGLGIPKSPEWVGTSLLELLSKPDNPDRIVFSEYHAVASPSGGFTVANAKWKYDLYVGYPPELFDLKNDPLETRNLAGDPRYSDVEARMHAHLMAICDPAEVDRHAKEDQNKLVASFGGPEVAATIGPKGASPVSA